VTRSRGHATLRLALAVACVLATGSIVLAQSGSSHDLHWTVFGSSGGSASGANHRIGYSLGQPSALGTSTGDSHVVRLGFWQWASEPTAVELARFEAWPEGLRTVHVQWETAQELDNLGFNLYRSNTRLGPKLKLNREMIPSNVPPGSPFGAVYDWIDTFRLRPGRAYFYWLEDVDLYGRTTLHGPVRARVQ